MPGDDEAYEGIKFDPEAAKRLLGRGRIPRWVYHAEAAECSGVWEYNYGYFGAYLGQGHVVQLSKYFKVRVGREREYLGDSGYFGVNGWAR